MLKNKIFTILMIISLSLPVYSLPEDNDFQPVNDVRQEEVAVSQELSGETELQNEPEKVENVNPIPYKQPVSKRKFAKKMILAMLSVAGSSLLIYIALTLYNRIRGFTPNSQYTVTNKNEGSLESPNSLSEAVKSFVDKTKWD